MRLRGKLAVITAAASGMGAAGCDVFAREGATIAAVDIDERRLADVVATVQSTGARARGFVADLSTVEGSRRFIHEAADWMGGIDILWAHAGCPGPAGIENMDVDAYQRTIDLNLRTSVLSVSEAVPYMKQRGGGAIVLTASMGGLVGSMLMPVYSAAKFAVVGLAKSLAQTLAPHRIRVNALCPGLVETPMLPEFMARGGNVEEATRRYLVGVPMGRVGLPTEIAKGALFLASDDDASYVTGIALPVDGGYTAR
jgi:NAD(P)-dependent dehydrogenase (short-subunit alcohol dehydrogenase family)